MLHQPAAGAYLLLLHKGAVAEIGVCYKVLFLQFGFTANSNFHLLQINVAATWLCCQVPFFEI